LSGITEENGGLTIGEPNSGWLLSELDCLLAGSKVERVAIRSGVKNPAEDGAAL
jgi:hypothetical protein